jgi:CheY-like chemotaxis protein
MIRRNIELEARLIDDLLDLSRVAAGKLRLDLQPTRVHDLLQHIVRNAASDLAGKSITIRTAYEAGKDVVIGDSARLQQVFWNLVRNATKFTPDGGEIGIRTWNDDKVHISVEVKDNGFGIPPDVLPRLFNMFEQGDISITQHFGGLGLGLSVSKAIVDVHGGTIRAESPGRGGGATFTVALPLGKVSQKRADLSLPSATLFPPIRLLLVEDHRDTARVLTRLLQNSGALVTSVGSVGAALRAMAMQPFDLMVSDIGLPDATGLELMRQARARYQMKGIALSGYGMEEDIRASVEAGFSDHLVKPITIQQLRDAIERVSAEVRK